MSGNSVEELNRVTDPLLRSLVGQIRRVAIKVTASALWQMVGYKLPGQAPETRQVEAFTGIGFYARPPRSGKPEAICVFVAGAKSPAIVATRDEKTRAQVADLGEDESAIFNTRGGVFVNADGTIEVRSALAPLVEPMLKADTYRAAEDALLTALQAWAAAVATALGTIPTFPAPAATAFASATTALGTAITAFKSAGAAYKTTVLRGQ